MSEAWEELRRAAQALSPELRERLTGEWARDGQFEHASIASFGRFALELLAVAAPAELVERAHRAAIDEIGHARLCFSLASIYAGASLGPGPLPIEASAFTKPTLASMVHATVLEGCVNETLAALEAAAARELAELDAVREALTAIERQESEHASLAFAFTSWAIASGGPQVREVARAAFAVAAASLGTGDAGAEASPELGLADGDAVMRRHGRLSAAARSQLRQRAMREVIAPAAAVLLGG